MRHDSFGSVRSTRRAARAPRGLAALTIVMVLFLIMAMVAAYTNRNLIFEQRTAANSYRSERALVAADAAIDWAMSALNGGIMDDQCLTSTNASVTYRERLLVADTDGRLSPRMAAASSSTVPLYSGCINDGNTLHCSCPMSSDATAAVASSAELPGTAFRVTYQAPGASPRPGAVTIDVRGCGTPGSGDSSCISSSSNPQVDGMARVTATLGLVRALPSRPVAAVTAAGSVVANGNEFRISNPDALTGLTVHAGNAFDTASAAATSRFVGPAGSAGNGISDNDATLRGRALTALGNGGTSADEMFTATFGIDGPNYRRQQGVVRKRCDTACGVADLDYMLKLFPGRTLWFDGDLNIDGTTTAAGGSLGSTTRPMMVIATGTLTIDRANPMVGLLYGSAVVWNAAGATLQGAVISATDLVASANVAVSYDPAVINTLVTTYGTFVRVQGSWTRRPF